ncbi:FG-GAP-like repeat-containing protein [Botrimarina mediterranea]|uniref:FG-GAP-like repeat-containing protein n=1 Tax=Botrimarina mediterranea TaxID=2528022 RepID=UPI0018D32B59|nr:FG-GAP-like repeat-containing protein [Botrimarina mediterranea]
MEDRRLLAADFGDAPAPYPTLMAVNGAQHAEVSPGGLQLGAAISFEAEGQPSASANADSGDDGIDFGMVRVGQLDAEVTVTVTNAPAAAKLDGWIDFNGDGSWGGADERVFASIDVAEGVNLLTFDVPSAAMSGETYARFRLSTAGGLGVTGLAADGEVEDFVVFIAPPTERTAAFADHGVIATDPFRITKFITTDLDDDGDSDLIVYATNSSSPFEDTLAWYSNDGDQAFQRRVIATRDGFNPTSIRAADIDNDGDQDLLVSYPDSNLTGDVYWYRNDGSENFSSHRIASGSYASDAALGDIDGDGDLDLVTGGLKWYANDGQGIFSYQAAVPSTLQNDSRVNLADLDQDGDLDIVVGSYFGDFVWFENNGLQQFTQRSIANKPGYSPFPIAIDMDGDGDLDVFPQEDKADGLEWYQNSGAGTFTKVIVDSETVSLRDHRAADFDGDGDIDIVSSHVDGSLVLYERQGQGYVRRTLGVATSDIAVVDLDRDGDLDVLTLLTGSVRDLVWFENRLAVHLGASTPTAAEETSEIVSFDFFVDAPHSESLLLAFRVEGTARVGSDFTLSGYESFDGAEGTVLLPAGQTSVSLLATLTDDASAEVDESIVVTLLSTPSYAPSDVSNAVTQILSSEVGADFGDAPGPYPTLLAENGARHSNIGPGELQLGGAASYEADGLPSAAADADLNDDGVVFGEFRVGQNGATVEITVTNAPNGAKLDGWIDFNADGSWGGLNERLFTAVGVTEGVNLLTFNVPGWAVSGVTYARFRLSTAGGLPTTGFAADGEVEDYAVMIEPTQSYSTAFGTANAIRETTGAFISVTTLDIEGDGDVDIVATTSGSGAITLFENDGANAFTSRSLFSTSSTKITSVEAADIDGDGDTDIVALPEDGWVLILENDGSGTFSWYSLRPSSTSPGDLSPVDMDGDGDIDLVVSSRDSDRIAWYENRGDKEFFRRTITTDADEVSDIQVVDLDRDGDLDVISRNPGDSTLSWYENDGAQSFSPRLVATGVGATASPLHVADYDRDGDLDLITFSIVDASIVWYENDGAEAFSSRAIPSSVRSGRVRFVGDIDGNGLVDIVAESFVSNSTAICLFNRGDGSFTEQVIASRVGRVADVHATDIDRDGDIDLLATHDYTTPGVVWYEAVYNASLTSIPGDWTEGSSDWAVEFRIPEAIDRPTTLAFTVNGEPAYEFDYTLAGAASFDGARGFVEIPAGETVATILLSALDDGLYELDEAVTVTLLRGPGENARPLSAHTNSIRSTQAGASFGDAPQPYPTRPAEGGAAHTHVGDGSLRLGELVDGRADGVPSPGADANVSDDGVVFGAMRVGQLDAAVTVTVSNAPDGAKLDAWIDFNGDGSWGGADEHIFASVHVVNGENVLTFDVPTVITSGVVTYARFRLSSSGGLAPGGIAADGEVEDYAVTMLPPTPTSGEFGEPTQILPLSAIRPIDVTAATSVVPADMDGDGDIDLVLSRGLKNDNLYWYENQAGQFSTAHLIGQRGDFIRVADLDRDGDLDVVATDQGQLAWFENRGAEGFVRNVIASGSLLYPTSPIAIADFGGDGWLDIAVINNAGSVLLWRRGEESATYTSTLIGGAAAGTVSIEAVDLNRDGRLDLVASGLNFPFGETVGLFQGETGQFSRRTLDGGRTSASSPIDMDRDGDIDVVIQIENGVAWLENDGSGSFAFRAVGSVSGFNNDMAVADFDGDGDFDIVDTHRRTSFESKSFTLFNNDGANKFQATTIDSNPSEYYYSVFPADINGDGALDLVAVVPNVGVLLYTQMLRAVPTSSSPNLLNEGDGPITIRLALQAETNADVAVPFTISGEAVYGVDYVIDGADFIIGGSGVVTIPAGTQWVELTLTVIADGEAELHESLAISVGDRPGDRLVWRITADADVGDYGDAPAIYPVGVEQAGAAHLAVGPRLGETRTAEPQGVATSGADGDAGDDGVVFGTLVVGTGTSTMTADVQNAPEGAYLDAWIDFNGDGSWSGEREQVFTRHAVVEGENVLRFETPSWATIGTTYARVRLSSMGGLGVTGNAADGEVEDYQVTIATAPGGWVDYEVQGVDPVGAPSTLAKVVDLDSDGFVDMTSVGLPSDRSLYWLRNTGDGTFSKQVLAVVDFTMRDFAIDDIDGDGDLDIVVISQTSPSTSRLVLLRNNGANAFSLNVIATSIEASMTVAIADIDGDGAMDIMAGGDRSSFSGVLPSTGEIVWYVNDGVGGFSPRLIDSQLGPVRSLGAADLDGDGDLDLYASAMNAGSLVMYRNDGAASFTKEVIVATTFTGPYMLPGGKVRAADFDGDGDLDLIPTPNGYSPPKLVWYENDGAGLFIERMIYAGVLYSNDVLPVDLDGDGDLDLVIGLATTAPSDKPAWIETRLAGDANNDGVVDLADRDFWGANYGSTSGPGLLADITGDGLVNAADYTSWRDAYASGVASTIYLPRVADWRLNASGLAVGDLDGDLDLDLIAATSTGVTVAINTFLSPPPTTAPSSAPMTPIFATSEAPLVAGSQSAISFTLPEPSKIPATTPRQRYASPVRESNDNRSISLLMLHKQEHAKGRKAPIRDEAFAVAADEGETADLTTECEAEPLDQPVAIGPSERVWEMWG